MIDPISLLIGAGLVGGGWALGRFGSRPAKKPAVATALCGCGHDLAVHDRESGQCHGETFRNTGVGIKAWVPCNCRRYTGPTPLEEFFAPPVLPPNP
ncbi:MULTISPECIES: hypothetical protein [unclassified Nocardia]|uniref:hypothetical protein n=1 Tax=unclassified Nocardia TaxID=2637762 RepID=UPI0035D7A22F